jgi:outer membrane murein-binding lipoprotein Lpp
MEFDTKMNCLEHGCSYCTKLNDKYNQLSGKVSTLEDDRRMHEQRISTLDANHSILATQLKENYSQLTSVIAGLDAKVNDTRNGVQTLITKLAAAFPNIFQ